MNITKLLSIGEIKEELELYPRHVENKDNWVDWRTKYRYSEAMKAGAIFPPIKVAFFKGSYYLIDGKHRIEAYKICKVDTVETIVLKVKSKDEIFEEAVKSNITHGRSLSIQSKVEVILKFKNMDFTDQKISEIMNIPTSKINSFVADRVVSSVNGEEYVLKTPLKSLAGSIVGDSILEKQAHLPGRTPMQIINDLLIILESDVIEPNNVQMLNKLKKIRKLIQQLVLKKRR